MNTEEKDAIIAYTKKMLDRGDSFRNIISYLDRKGIDKDLKSEIITNLDTLQKLRNIKPLRKENEKLISDSSKNNDLFISAIKMFNRGYNLDNIMLYVDRRGADSDLKKEIVLEIEYQKSKIKENNKINWMRLGNVVFNIIMHLAILLMIGRLTRPIKKHGKKRIFWENIR